MGERDFTILFSSLCVFFLSNFKQQIMAYCYEFVAILWPMETVSDNKASQTFRDGHILFSFGVPFLCN